MTSLKKGGATLAVVIALSTAAQAHPALPGADHADLLHEGPAAALGGRAHVRLDDPLAAPRARLRRFTEADKHRVLEEAAQPGASLAQIARRYGIARRVLCRWKQELAPPPIFVTVEITNVASPAEEHAP